MKPHKWAKEIKAWADGAEIEQRLYKSNGWTKWEIPKYTPTFFTDGAEFRIKPQPKKDWVMICKRCGDEIGIVYEPKEPQYLYVYQSNSNDYIFDIGLTEHPRINPNLWTKIGKIKLEDK
jgi:hypothetical protein